MQEGCRALFSAVQPFKTHNPSQQTGEMCSLCSAQLQLKYRNQACLSPCIAGLVLTSGIPQHGTRVVTSQLSLHGSEHWIPVNRFNYSASEIQ